VAEEVPGPARVGVERWRVIFVGIDPGKEGAVGWMDGERRNIGIADTPLLPDGNYDIFGAYKLLQDACLNGSVPVHVTIEDTISVPHVARGERFLPASDKQLNMSLGIWLGLCPSFRATMAVVHPKTWKRSIFAGIANDDVAEERAIKQRFAGHSIVDELRGPKGGKRPGRVDALAICEHGRVTWRFAEGQRSHRQ
jgi:hypothetical protein